LPIGGIGFVIPDKLHKRPVHSAIVKLILRGSRDYFPCRIG
jgi:hypothetical protein